MYALPFDDNDDLEIFGPPPETDARSPIATDAAGTIQEDVYCLTCGYNLRGLSGDPVRCPECGEYNNLGVVALPARFIRSALRNMETLPTLCVAQVVGLLLSLLFAAIIDWPGKLTPLLIGGGFAGAWFFARSRVRRSFDDQPGWGKILGDFHLATFFCTLLIPLFLLSMFLATELRVVLLGPALLVTFILAAVGFLLGLRIYYDARRRMDAIQRETAVRIATEHLRRSLHAPKGRRPD